MKVKTTLLLLLALGFSIAASAQCNGATFEEQGGIVVIEAETVSLTGAWRKQSSVSGASRGVYLNWTGAQYFTDPGNGTIQYKVKINSPGTYRFNWRSKIGTGNSTTEHNDTWLRIPDANDFYGQRGGSRIYPRGSGKSPNPEGASSEGWFKIYMNSLDWVWSALTSDFDPHEIYARFDSAGVYTIQLSARSSGHLIDRMILYKTNQFSASSAESLSRAETLCDGGTTSPPPPTDDGGTNTSPSVSITSPQGGANLTAGTDVSINLSANDPDGSIVKHQIFVNGTLVDTDGSNYTPYVINNVTEGTYAIRARVTDNDGAINESTISFSVGGSTTTPPPPGDDGGDTGGSNAAPTVNITNPSNGANFAPGTNVNINLSANDTDGTVVLHQIYVNGVLVDTDPANFTPYTITNAVSGNYTVRAVVTDDDSATGEASVSFSVGEASNDDPGDLPQDPPSGSDEGIIRIVLVNTVTNTDIGIITQGASFDSNTLPASLSIRADTNPTDVGNVFFGLSGPLNITKAEGSSPYHIFGDIGVQPIGTSFPDGSYTLNVAANVGDPIELNFTIQAGSGTSVGGNAAPSVTITSPSNGQNFAPGSDVTVNLSASDSDGSVVKHQIYVNGTLVDTDPSFFTPHIIQNISSGAYTIRAVVTDDDGATAASSVNITVGSASTKTVVDLKATAYPNPTPDGSLTVEFPRPMGKQIGYQLMSPSGQLIDTGVIENGFNADSSQLKLRSLEQSQEGIYYLTLTDGAQSYVVPIIRK